MGVALALGTVAAIGLLARRRGSRARAIHVHRIEVHGSGGVDANGEEELRAYAYDEEDFEEEEAVNLTAYVGPAARIRARIHTQATGARRPWETTPIPPVQTIPALGRSPVGFIDDVMLATTIRGDGWGRKLWQLTAEAMRARGARRVFLLATRESHGFWRAMGFEDTGWWGGDLRLMVAPTRRRT